MKVCAGIVLFEPDINRLLENIDAIITDVEHIYIVDNGSSNIKEVRSAFEQASEITFTENGENLGIAKALNQLCWQAKADGFDYIVTLDQDSVSGVSMVDEMLPYATEKTAIIAPFVVDDYEKTELSQKALFEEINRCNTSGCLTNLKVWEEIGGFDERMFIDCVDFDYCTRSLKQGYKIMRVNRALLHHRLGKAKEVRFFVFFGKLFKIKKLQKPFYTYNHSPLRTYYYARNILYYMHKHKDFIDMKQEKRTYIRWFLLKVFFESQKLKKLWAIIKGSLDSKKLKRLYDQSGK